LIASQAGSFVHRAALAARAVEVPFAAGHKEGTALREAVEALEIDVAPVHHIEGARLDRQQVENRHVVHFSVGNMHETRNAAAQIEQRVQLDGSLLAAKLGPREQAQAEVDGRRVEGIDSLIQVHGERLANVQLAGSANQHLRKIGIDSPIVNAVGIGQRAPRNLAAKAGVVQFRSQGVETRLDVPQAFAKRKLRESQAQKLIATRETALTTMAVIPPDTGVEFVPGQEVHELCEHQWTRVHASSSTTWKCFPGVDSDDPSSNRARTSCDQTPFVTMTSSVSQIH
jgi:hypothetical protein